MFWYNSYTSQDSDITVLGSIYILHYKADGREVFLTPLEQQEPNSPNTSVNGKKLHGQQSDPGDSATLRKALEHPVF